MRRFQGGRWVPCIKIGLLDPERCKRMVYTKERKKKTHDGQSPG
jgi:hypothetical protein